MIFLRQSDRFFYHMNEVDLLFQAHIEVMNKIMPCIGQRQGKISLPYFPESHIGKVCQSAYESFLQEPTVLEIEVPMIVVGDIRGSLFNLYNILKRYELPPARRFFFLGNFLGEGGFSLEVMTLLFALKSVFPRHIFIIRGENEYSASTIMNMFEREISASYSDDLVAGVKKVLNQLPICARIFDNILCVHGGIPTRLQNLEDLNDVDRKTLTLGNPLVCGLIGQKFEQLIDNEEKLEDFMDNNEISLIIHGHDRVTNGVQIHNDEKIVTLFSASHNSSSVLEVTSLDEIASMALDPIPKIFRNDTIYTQWKKANTELTEANSLILPPLRTSNSNQPGILVMNSHPVVSMNHPIHSQLHSYQIMQKITRVNAPGAPQNNPNFKPRLNPASNRRFFKTKLNQNNS